MRKRIMALALVLALVALGCSDDSSEESTAIDGSETTGAPEDPPATTSPETTAPETTVAHSVMPDADPYDGYVTDLYDDPALWICWPGADDVCSANNDLTLVSADGSLEVVPWAKADDAAIDCFYVYPTISRDETASSDLIPQDDQEIFTVRSQAARYGSVCDVYAPVYRQNTIPSMLGQVEPPEGVDTREVAYADVLDAWKHYISTANDGRGFVLLGHSQGSGLLRRLIAEEIDGVPDLQNRFITAHLLGTSVTPGPDGSFATIPTCESADEIGCVISYATFRSTAPPPESSFFGRTDAGPAACTNPGDLAGGPATLQPEYLVNGGSGGLAGASPFADPAGADAITTPWVGYPDFIIGECIDDGTFGYLEVEILGDPADPRADDVGGDLTPDWGLHLADAQVAMGDLVALVAAQAAVYAG